MATPSPVYGSMVSIRSRRLRTIGSLLLVAIFVMVLYGVGSLMPSLRRSIAATPISVHRSFETRTPEEQMRRKILATQLIFAYAYWAGCGVLVVSAIFVAYLDFREVSRNYLAQRRAIWKEETAGELRINDEG